MNNLSAKVSKEERIFWKLKVENYMLKNIFNCEKYKESINESNIKHHIKL
jgi:hypothetical protein